MAVHSCVLLALALQGGGPTIRARVVDVERAPLAGVDAEFSSSALAGSARSVSTTSDEQGVLRIELGDGSLPEGQLLLRHPGMATRRLVLAKDQATSERDLGVVQLEPAGALDVAILGRDGTLLVDGWTVQVASRKNRPKEFGAPRVFELPANASVGVDRLTGSAVFTGLPFDSYRVDARHASGALASIEWIDVTGIERRSVVLKHHGPAPERVLRVQIATSGPWPSALERPFFAIELATGRRVPLERESARSAFVAEDVAPGLYHVVSDWDALAGWRSEPLSTGVAATLQLQCSVVLSPVVVDARTGARLTEWSAQLLEPRALDLDPRGGLLTLPAGDSRLVVAAAGYAEREVVLRGLVPSETSADVRRKVIELEPLGPYDVRVYGPGGVPAPGVVVQVCTPDGPSRFPSIGVTDAEGIAHLEDVPPGRRLLRVASGVGGWEERVIDVRADGSTSVTLSPTFDAQLTVALPEWLRGPVVVRVHGRSTSRLLATTSGERRRAERKRVQGVAVGERLLIEVREVGEPGRRILARCAPFEPEIGDVELDLEEVEEGTLFLAGDLAGAMAVELAPARSEQLTEFPAELRLATVEGSTIRLPRMPRGSYELVLYRDGRFVPLGLEVESGPGSYPTLFVALSER